jgi:hypothetical protein
MARLSRGLNVGGGATWAHILREESIHRTRTVKVANRYLAAHGVDRKTKSRALDRLVAAGLIRWDFKKKGKSPVVTLLI